MEISFSCRSEALLLQSWLQLDNNLLCLHIEMFGKLFMGAQNLIHVDFLAQIVRARRVVQKSNRRRSSVPDRLLRGLKQNKTKGVLRWRRKKPDLDKVSSPAEVVSVFSDTRLAVAGNVRCLRLQWQISGSSPTFLHKKEDFNVAIFK